jgi:uncharacterized membrane protein YbhN (UPF0104 family)
LTTIIIEKSADLVATGLIAVSIASLTLTPAWLCESATSFLWIALTLGAGLMLMWGLRKNIGPGLEGLVGSGRFWPERWSDRLLSSVQLALETLGALSQWHFLVRVIAWTIAAWLVSLLTMLALFAAFGLELPLMAAIVLMLAVSMSNVAPSPPGLVGVIHGIAMIVLAQYGVTQAVVFGFGLVLNLVIVVPPLFLGSLALWSHFVPLLGSWYRRLFMEYYL